MREALTWLLAPGGLGLLVWFGYKLHLDAVNAERRRADDARARAEAAERRAELREEQIAILLGRRKGPG